MDLNSLEFEIFALILLPTLSSSILYGAAKLFVKSYIKDVPENFRRVKPAKFIKRLFKINRQTIPLIIYIHCIVGFLALLRIPILYILDIFLVVLYGSTFGVALGLWIEHMTAALFALFTFPSYFTIAIQFTRYDREEYKRRRKLRQAARKAGTYKKPPNLFEEIRNEIHLKSYLKRTDSFGELKKQIKKNYIDSKYSTKNKYYIASKNAKKVEELIANEYPHTHIQYKEEKNKKTMVIYGKYSDNRTCTVLEATIRDK